MIKNFTNNSNKSKATRFLLNAAQKRRKMAIATAQEVQCELGVAPNLFALK